jgi:hypothetical protein
MRFLLAISFIFLYTNLFSQQILYKSGINSVNSNENLLVPWLSPVTQSTTYLFDRYITFIDPESNSPYSGPSVEVHILIRRPSDKIKIIQTVLCDVGDGTRNHLYNVINLKKGDEILFIIHFSSETTKRLIFDVYSLSKHQSKVDFNVYPDLGIKAPSPEGRIKAIINSKPKKKSLLYHLVKIGSELL